MRTSKEDRNKEFQWLMILADNGMILHHKQLKRLLKLQKEFLVRKGPKYEPKRVQNA